MKRMGDLAMILKIGIFAILAMALAPFLSTAADSHVPSFSTDVEGDIAPELPPRPSITITEEVGPNGFVLGEDPVTGEPIHNIAMGVRGGSGTADDPYVITNWTVIGTETTAIRIEGTSSHVIIEDIFLPGKNRAPTPIFLMDAENVTLDRVWVNSGQLPGFPGVSPGTGLLMMDVANVTVTSSLVGDASNEHLRAFSVGVSILDSQEVTLENVTVRTAEVPMVVRDSLDIDIGHATFVDDPIGDGQNIQIGPVEGLRVTDSLFAGVTARLDDVVTDVHFAHNRFEAEPEMHVHEEVFEEVAGFGLIRAPAENGVLAFQTLVEDSTFCANAFDGPFRNTGIQAFPVENVTLEGNVFEGPMQAMLLRMGEDLALHRNDVRATKAFFLEAEDALLRNNSFTGFLHPEFDIFSIPSELRSDADARHNWWNHSSGPNVTDEEGPGEGVGVDTGGNEVLLDPWLTAPPETGPGAVECEVASSGLEPGAQEGPGFVVSASANVQAHGEVHQTVGPEHVREEVGPVKVDEKIGPYHVRGEVVVDALVQSPVVAVPERTPAPLSR